MDIINILELDNENREIITCASCGDTFEISPNEEGIAERIICPQCLGLSYCECCHSWVAEDLYRVDGMAICESCYENYTDTDFFTRENHFRKDMYFLFFVPDGIDVLKETYSPYFVSVYKPEEVDWSKYLVSEDGFIQIKQECSYFWCDEKFYLDVPAIRISSILPEAKKEYFPLWTPSKWEKIEKMI